LAADWGRFDAVQKELVWAKGNLTREDIINTFLFSTDNVSWTAWHLAAQRGHVEALQKL
jgi:hypothetical protein